MASELKGEIILDQREKHLHRLEATPPILDMKLKSQIFLPSTVSWVNQFLFSPHLIPSPL